MSGSVRNPLNLLHVERRDANQGNAGHSWLGNNGTDMNASGRLFKRKPRRDGKVVRLWGLSDDRAALREDYPPHVLGRGFGFRGPAVIPVSPETQGQGPAPPPRVEGPLELCSAHRSLGLNKGLC